MGRSRRSRRRKKRRVRSMTRVRRKTSLTKLGVERRSQLVLRVMFRSRRLLAELIGELRSQLTGGSRRPTLPC